MADCSAAIPPVSNFSTIGIANCNKSQLLFLSQVQVELFRSNFYLVSLRGNQEELNGHHLKGTSDAVPLCELVNKSVPLAVACWPCVMVSRSSEPPLDGEHSTLPGVAVRVVH